MSEEHKKRGVEEITEDKWPPFPASQILAEIYLIHQKQQQQQQKQTNASTSLQKVLIMKIYHN